MTQWVTQGAQMTLQGTTVGAWCGAQLNFDNTTLPVGWILTEFGAGPFYANGRLQSPAAYRTPRLDASGAFVFVLIHEVWLAPAQVDNTAR